MVNLIRQSDSAWSIGKQCNNPGSWNKYRAFQIFKKFTKLVKAAISDHYLNLLNENLNNPCTFWKLVKSTEGTMETRALPDMLRINEKKREKATFLIFIAKALVGKLPPYMCSFLTR